MVIHAAVNIEEYISTLRGRVDALLTDFQPLRIAVSGFISDATERIWDQSKNSAGQDLLSVSPYDTNPIYVSPDRLPRKSGSNIGKRDKEIRSLYFSEGWSEVKAEVGRPAAELFGTLRSDFANAEIVGQGTKFQVKLKQEENIGKAKGLQKKYGKLFLPTKEEKERLLAAIKDETIRAIKGL